MAQKTRKSSSSKRKNQSSEFSAERIVMVLGFLLLGAFVSVTLRTGSFAWISRILASKQTSSPLDPTAQKQSALGNLSFMSSVKGGLISVRSLPSAPSAPVPASASEIGRRNVTLAIRGFLAQNPDFKPKTDQQEAEWRDGGVSFLTGHASCAALCGADACARDWFEHLDRCPAAQVAFPQGRCAEVYRPSAPSFEAR
eukprot:CAMPEP_0172189862 /NCGR_PEP_ID=MMETSP1050-20130122/22773_1 /TAXON_ID=233186 /ORGANISM="Cryptomonas curvata, Strain CCAP979/52" /LENGTH=197 /DNA_ID=CAMNT_0012864631 /DNA_START=114 /DNA_END=703 /DNA_ORIENTATION=+